jgi:hypothetical protein
MTNRQDPDRNSFLGLPNDLRQKICGYLFDVDPQHRQLLKTICEPQRDCIMHWAQKLFINANVLQSITSLPTVGTVGKAVCQDMRSFFYASTDLFLYNDGITGPGYFGLLEKLLLNLAPMVPPICTRFDSNRDFVLWTTALKDAWPFRASFAASHSAATSSVSTWTFPCTTSLGQIRTNSRPFFH